MPPLRHCSECGAVLPVDAPRGACPRCLLLRGFESLPPDEAPDPHATVHLVLAEGPEGDGLGSEFGDYELLEEIGRGGMGVIYRARQRNLDRIVALKLVRAGALTKADAVARFKLEAAATARLRHPGIVTVHDVGEHDGQHYYSMDFVPGRSLAAALRAAPFTPRGAARCVQAIAAAIQFAHERGVLHRDLKPSNILLDAEGLPHVADFGLAKLLHSDSELTQTGAALGSPNYMPPEQARGHHAGVSARSDVYSLGAILYECLTGRPPFTAATPLETMNLVVGQEPVSPRGLNPALPRDLETICLKCLAKEPAQRYPTAQELAGELGRFLADEPIRARPAGAAERAWRWCRRQPATAALLAVCALALIAFAVILFTSNARVRQEQSLTRENLYAADLALAFDALARDDHVVAHRALAAHLVTNETSDLRGFEWRWLWQRARGEARSSFEAHYSQVWCIAWSADGRLVGSGGLDGRAVLWDAATGTPLRTLVDADHEKILADYRRSNHLDRPQRLRRYSAQHDDQPHQLEIMSIAFSPDSRALVLGKGVGPQLWDPATGEFKGIIGPRGFSLVSFAPGDGQRLIGTPNYPRDKLAFLDLSSGRFLNTWSNRADAFCLSPDGQWAAVWSRRDYRVRIRRIPDGTLSNEWSTGRNYVLKMAWSPDGQLVAAGDQESGNVDIFNLADGTTYARLKGQTGRFASLAFSPDGRLLATGNYDQSIRLWDVGGKREARRLHGHRSVAMALAFSPDGQRLVSGGFDGAVSFWDVAAPSEPPALTNVSGRFAFSPDGQHLLTQNTNGQFSLWALPERRLVRAWDAGPFSDLAFTANGEIAAARFGGSNSVPIIQWFAPEAETAARPAGGSPDPQHLQPEGTGSKLPSLSSSKSAAALESPAPPADAAAVKRVELNGVPSPCSAIALAPDAAVCVSGHRDGTVAFWEPRTGRLLSAAWRRHWVFTNEPPSEVYRFEFAADGRTLASVSRDHLHLKLWSVPEHREIASRYFGAIYDLITAVSPDGRQVALGGMQQGLSVNFWDANLRASPRQLEGHQDFLHAIAYAPDGRTMATGGRDGLLKLWHLPTGRQFATLLTLEHTNKFQQLTFSPDGSWLGALDRTGTLHLWHAPPPAAASGK